MLRLRTQVAIIGAGPCGLMLSHLLRLQDVASIVLERRSRIHCEQRVRAGLLEEGSAALLRKAGLAARLDAEGLRHTGLELRFGGIRYRLPFTEFTGKATYMYGQQEVVKDLLRAHDAGGSELYFEVEDATIHSLTSTSPCVRGTLDGRETEIECDVVVGCDGYHGISRPAVPRSAISAYERDYPLAWLGVLVAAPPKTSELVYAIHERGFALYSMRSPQVSRLYLQVEAGEDLARWSDDRVWSELQARVGDVAEGPVLERGITRLRAYVADPMRYGRLLLAGDAAHIVPPTAAKGLNLALGDAVVLSEALCEFLRTRDEGALDDYSARRLRAAWQAQEFSDRLTSLFHRMPYETSFDAGLRQAALLNLAAEGSAALAFSADYVGASRNEDHRQDGRAR